MAIVLIHRIFGASLYLPDLKRVGLALFRTLIGIGNLILQPANVLVVNGETLIDSIWNGKGRLQYPVFSKITISTFIAYGIFLVILYAVFLTFNRGDFLYVLRTFVKYSKILIVFGYIEFLTKLLICFYISTILTIYFGCMPIDWGRRKFIEPVFVRSRLFKAAENRINSFYRWSQ